MPATPHVERHFTGSESVRDVVIGMADGLTVPFALAAGLSAAVTSSQIIVTAGLAEVAAGVIAVASADTSPRVRTKNITPPRSAGNIRRSGNSVRSNSMRSRASFAAMDWKDLHSHR